MFTKKKIKDFSTVAITTVQLLIYLTTSGDHSKGSAGRLVDIYIFSTHFFFFLFYLYRDFE